MLDHVAGQRSHTRLLCLAGMLGIAGVVVTGCASGAATSSKSGGSSLSPVATATTSSQPAARSGPTELPVMHEGPPREISPGTYTTSKPNGFFPGLTLKIPAGWSVTEADTGEIGLHPSDRPDDAVLLWKDLVAVVTNNRSGKVGQPDEGVGSTAAALVTWLTSTSDFEIVAAPKAVTVGEGIAGKQLTLTTSASANFGWDDCPDNPRCAAILTDPKHWGSGFYAIGGGEILRIFVTTLHYPEGDHTFFVALDATSADHLESLANEAQPIIDSLRFPATYFAN